MPDAATNDHSGYAGWQDRLAAGDTVSFRFPVAEEEGGPRAKTRSLPRDRGAGHRRPAPRARGLWHEQTDQGQSPLRGRGAWHKRRGRRPGSSGARGSPIGQGPLT